MLPALPTPASADPSRPVAADPYRRGPLRGLHQGLKGLARGLAGALPLRLVTPARLLVPLLLVVLLAGCSGTAQPPRRVVLDALALQIRLTQDQVAQALGVPPGGLPEVSRVRVEQQQSLPIGAARGLRLSGRFDWRLAEDPIRVDSPFELYLQRGERGQSWRLARPAGTAQGETDDAVQSWLTDPLPLPAERSRAAKPAPAGGSDRTGSDPASAG